MSNLKVQRDEVVDLLQAIGFKTAGGWDRKKLAAKITELSGSINAEDFDWLTPAQEEMLNLLIITKGNLEVLWPKGEDEGEDKDEAAEAPAEVPVAESPAEAPVAPVEEDKAPEAPAEAPVPKKRGRKPNPDKVQTPKKPPRSMTRIQSICQAISELKESTVLDELAVVANGIYVAAGGRDSVKQSRFLTATLVEAAEAWKIACVDGVKVAPISN